MKYAHLEENTNKLLGWYLEKGKGRIEVSDKVWQDALKINANCYENGSFIVKDFRTPEEITEVNEKNRINTINQKANEVIESKYPLCKQLNIRAKLIKDEDGSHYTDTDIEVMDMFIDTVRGIAKQAKANGIPAYEVDW